MVAKEQKGVIVKDSSIINRQFSYSLDGVNLNFSLRIDVKKELKTFLELMEAAKRDIELQLEDIKLK